MSARPLWDPPEEPGGKAADLPWRVPQGDGSGPAPPDAGADRSDLQRVKARVHRLLIERLNLSSLEDVDPAEARGAIRSVVHGLLAEEPMPLNFDEREQLLEQILDEIFGLGPLQPLMQDPEVSDVLVNTFDQIYVERRGRLELTPVRFQDDRHLRQVIDRIVSAVGRRIDESSPMVDARLPDGSRVHAIIPPVAVDGPHLSIRKFKSDALTSSDLLRLETATEPMLKLLEAVVAARINILISGGTGAGKTTLLNILSSFIPADERIVTIEDSAELQLRQPHVVRLETRPPNVEGSGEISQRQLLVNALRMRPDRIVVGEVRGPETVDMLQAMNTGHEGSLTTVHANTTRDALSRLEVMVSMANLNLPDRAVRQQIASAIDVIIQVSRLSDGSRKVMTISEVTGMESGIITLQDIFVFEREGVAPGGKVLGRFRPTGIRPVFTERLKGYGIELSELLFSEGTEEVARW